MPAAISHRRVVLALAAFLFAGVFAAFVLVGSPSLGIGHFFYLPIALVALATRPAGGAAAGAVAASLYAVAIILNPEIPSAEALTLSTAIRLVNYSTTGALIGWFASDNRRLVNELRILAERDDATGLPNTRAFEAEIDRRLDADAPFALLIGDLVELNPSEPELDGVGVNDALVRLARTLGSALGPADDLARVGDRQFAVLASAGSSTDAARLAARLEDTLAAHGLAVTFGWAVHPQEGRNALSLYRAADERLYARKLVGSPLVRSRALRTAGQ